MSDDDSIGTPPSGYDEEGFDDAADGVPLDDYAPATPVEAASDMLERRLKELDAYQFQPPVEADADATGGLAYRAECEKIDKESFFRFPIDSVVDKFDKPDLDLSHSGLGDKGARALARSIEINTGITALTLVDNWITPVGGEAIMRALLFNKTIRTVDLGDNQLGAQALGNIEGAPMGALIRQVLAKNSVLQDLILRSNKISDRDMAEIAEGVQENVSMNAIDLSYNELGPKAGDAIAAMLANSSIRELNLEWNRLRAQGTLAVLNDGLRHNGTVRKFNIAWNGVGDEGGVIIGKIIGASAVLEELDISHNRIGPKGAEAIAEGIRESTTLVRLLLNDNPLKDEGCAAVIRALRDNKTLSRVDLRSTEAGKVATQELKETLEVKTDNFKIDVPRSLFMPTEW
jgi:Ran GTPase-activating protein (RanGAP) involved in mRNA processing and transport